MDDHRHRQVGASADWRHRRARPPAAGGGRPARRRRRGGWWLRPWRRRGRRAAGVRRLRAAAAVVRRPALPQVGPWGCGTPCSIVADGRAERAARRLGSPAARRTRSATAAPAPTPRRPTSTSPTSRRPTDGSWSASPDGQLVRHRRDRAPRPRELSRTMLPGPAHGAARAAAAAATVVVVGDERPAVPSATKGRSARREAPAGRPAPAGASDPRTRVVSLDLSNPAAPRVTDDRSIDGGALSTREYADGTVRVVRHHRLPAARLRAAQPRPDPRRGHPAQPGDRAARTRLRVAARASAPTAARSGRCSAAPTCGTRVQAVGARHHQRADLPVRRARSLTVRPRSPRPATWSTPPPHRLYVATTDGDRSRCWSTRATSGAPIPFVPTTQVHAFALDGDRTTYVASGSVRGTVKDRWSFDEHDGRLRVAAAARRNDDRRAAVDNGVLRARRARRPARGDRARRRPRARASRSSRCAGSATSRSS